MSALVRASLPFAPIPADLPRTREARWVPPSARLSLANLAKLGSHYAAAPLFSAEHVLALLLFLATQFSRRGSVVAADDSTVGYVSSLAGCSYSLPELQTALPSLSCVAQITASVVCLFVLLLHGFTLQQ